jgi:hypothetical protein
VKKEIDWKEDKGEYLYKYLSKVKKEIDWKEVKGEYLYKYLIPVNSPPFRGSLPRKSLISRMDWVSCAGDINLPPVLLNRVRRLNISLYVY